MKVATKLKRPKLTSPAFLPKVLEIRALIAAGNIEQATAVLDQAWDIAGKDKPSRAIAHDLGNDIQRIILEQYIANDLSA